jgi:outer membrane protein assembly factor BamD
VTALAILCGAATTARARGYKVRLSPEELFKLGELQLEKGKRLKAQETFRLLRDQYPASPYATTAQLRIADTLFAQKRWADAAVEYQLFMEFHPADPKADYCQFQLGLSRLKLIRAIDRDLTTTHEALAAFRKLINLYPTSPYAVQAAEKIDFLEDRLVAHDVYVGRFTYRIHWTRTAEPRLRSAVTAARSPELKAKAVYFLALTQLRRRREDEARALLRSLVLGPETKYSKRAARQLARIGFASSREELLED